MNVRIVPRDAPSRTDLYGGVTRVDGRDGLIILTFTNGPTLTLCLSYVAELLLDDEPGDWF